jgi:hypothetical protein
MRSLCSPNGYPVADSREVLESNAAIGVFSLAKIERNLTVRFLPALKDGASTAFRNSEALR